MAAPLFHPRFLAAFLPARSAESWGKAIRLIKHEAVPKCGSFEVPLPDRKPSKYFYWEDVPARALGRTVDE